MGFGIKAPTSGVVSSGSMLLGYRFCTMTMRAKRSEVVRVLAFRLEIERKTIIRIKLISTLTWLALE